MGLVGSWKVEFGLVLFGILVYVYVKIKKRMGYFKDRDIPYVASVSILGSSPGTSFTRHNALTWTEIYHKLAPHKVGGFYDLFLKRYYMVRDPEYIQLIFITHFHHFTDRGFHVDVEKDPLDRNLFFLNGSAWKTLRNKISPIFTTGRLKWLASEMEKSADRLEMHLDKTLPENVDVDIHESLARFTLDVIGSTVFGFETETLMGSENDTFREMTVRVFDTNVKNAIRMFFRLNSPELLKLFKIKTIESVVSDFFIKIVKGAFKHRTETKYYRKDVIQLLLELYQKGSISIEDTGDRHELDGGIPELEGNKLELTEEILAAQAFVLYMAGFETTSTTLHNLTYFLSINPEAQRKLRKEILDVKEKHGGLTFEACREMTYLDLCIMETLRLLPPLPMGFRECTKDYTFPNGVTIYKGEHVIVPQYSMQMDPDYYPDPTRFNPERFENGPVKGTYFPFGDGPRMCIGKRFAEFELKLAVSRMLQKYSFHPSDRDSTANVLAKWGIKPNALLMYPNNGLLVKVKKL